MKKYLGINILIILFLLSCVSFNNDSKLDCVFSLDDMVVIRSKDITSIRLTDENREKVKKLLLDAIDIATTNISNKNASKDENGNRNKPLFLYVDEDLQYTLKKDQEIVWIYDPLNPDADHSGEKFGYVSYPKINTQKQQLDIYKITEFIKKNNL